MRLLKDNCRSIRDLLPLHVGADLEAGPARRVDEHLRHCLSCFREFRELTAMRQRLGVLAEQLPPAAALDNFADEVMARIALGERGPAAELPGVRRGRPTVVLPLAAAATLMLGVMLGYLAQTRGAAVSPTLGPTAEPSSAVSQLEGLIPTEVRGSPVGNGSAPMLKAAPRLQRLQSHWPNELGRYWISPEERTLLDSAPITGPELRQLFLNGRRDGLSPEPDRQLRLRAPVVPPQLQDG